MVTRYDAKSCMDGCGDIGMNIWINGAFKSKVIFLSASSAAPNQMLI